MKQITFFCIISLIVYSSCSNKQDRIEDIVFAQIGDSCMSLITAKWKTGLTLRSIPPPPPDIVKRYILDTNTSKSEMRKFDTLGFPFKYSLWDSNFNGDTLSINKYYEEFSHSNEIRIKYLNENISVYDSLLVPTKELIGMAFGNLDLSKSEYNINSVYGLNQKLLIEKPDESFWDSIELKNNSNYVRGLKPNSIRFYRIIFTDDFSKGLLFIEFEIIGFIKHYGYLEIQKDNNIWHIKDRHMFKHELNKKRWRYE